MVNILLVCFALSLLSLAVGCGIGRLFHVGSTEDLADLQAGNEDLDGSGLNTPLPSSLRIEDAIIDESVLDPPLPSSVRAEI